MTVSLSDFNIKFGTSGARGLVADFSDAYCWTFVHAFLDALGPSTRRLIVGHDLRPSSPSIAAACMAAATASGVYCVYGGALPTPAIALAAQEYGFPAIVVTGSHIPADRNGIKAYRHDGEITKLDEQTMLNARVEPAAHSLAHRIPVAVPEFRRSYISRYTKAFPEDALSGLHIGVYEHSTVARDLLHDILRALGAQTVGLGRSESFLPVDTEAVRAEDKQLARDWAASGQFDAIVSADGDADRPLAADEFGTWLRGDVLGTLCALEIGANTVVTPVSSSTVIEKSGRFQQVLRTRIGSPYVIEGMQSASAVPPVVGFEANGGFLLGSGISFGGRTLAALPTRDAMLPILLLLARARRKGCKVSELPRELPQRHTHSDRLTRFATDRSRQLLEQLTADTALARTVMAPDSGAVIDVSCVDGLRIAFEHGDIVHLRPSGNAPELRCYTESANAERAEALCNDCLVRVNAAMPNASSQIRE